MLDYNELRKYKESIIENPVVDKFDDFQDQIYNEACKWVRKSVKEAQIAKLIEEDVKNQINDDPFDYNYLTFITCTLNINLCHDGKLSIRIGNKPSNFKIDFNEKEMDALEYDRYVRRMSTTLLNKYEELLNIFIDECKKETNNEAFDLSFDKNIYGDGKCIFEATIKYRTFL